ncbi:MAG: trypsin-like serine protease [Halobacteriovoraceae bacterium]|jgi:hypothetical protein|nr:trypsin-like serine protease [Halobacteriovoraceae bacterium]
MLRVLKTFILTSSLITMLSSHAIYNGVEHSNLKTSYVYKIEMEQDGHVDYPCSSTIISEHSFLTAAHCVDRLDINKDIYINVNGDRFKVEKLYIPIAYFDASKLYIQSFNTPDEVKNHQHLALFDIAIVNVKLPLPQGYRTVELLFNEVSLGSKVLATGYGFTMYDFEKESFYNSPTVPYERNLDLETLANGVYIVKGRDLADFITAPGDSGGPLLLEGTNKQVGILRGSSATDSSSASIYTPIYLHQKFIQLFSK